MSNAAFPSPIRLITCDIDGTLLQNGALSVDPEVSYEVDRLWEKGILFCPASGRQYDSLRRLFPAQADRLAYICENGAIVYGSGSPGPVLAKTPMPSPAVYRLCRDILELPGVEICISGANTSYLCPKTRRYADHIRYEVGNNTVILNDPEETPEEIIKVSAYCPQGALPVRDILFPRWESTLNCAVAGEKWIDFTLSDKGTGLMLICNALGILPEEVLSFGDNYNDLPLMDLVGYPYMMESAVEELRRRIPRHCRRVQDILKLL